MTLLSWLGKTDKTKGYKLVLDSFIWCPTKRRIDHIGHDDPVISFVPSLPARHYASAGLCKSNVSVSPSVRHAPVLCQKEES